VLAPEGRLHLVDFGGEAHDRGWVARFVHSHDELADNFGGAIPTRIREAGFAQVREVSRSRTLFGRVTHYEARETR
jgi:hypothetical protein